MMGMEYIFWPLFASSFPYLAPQCTSYSPLQVRLSEELAVHRVHICVDCYILEWTFLLRSDWSKVKALYIVTRYAPFIILTTVLYLCFTPTENPNKCRMLSNICSGFIMASAIGSESFFILRTCALWNNNRILLAALLVAGLMSPKSTRPTKLAVDAARLLSEYPLALPSLLLPRRMRLARSRASQGATGAQVVSSSSYYLLLSAFQLGIMILTLIRAIQSWQITSHLYSVLVKHNIFYYMCGFLFSVANIFVSVLLHYSYDDVLQVFQFMILAILATRMHLHLWQMNQQAHGSDALARIRMSDMASM
ncbi:hypothetical protein BDR07DRAFT_1053556 [Suillus spraguei]|nr:hypothetical protein BDR07DRAFT_1053556 [Suillus spraguei]